MRVVECSYPIADALISLMKSALYVPPCKKQKDQPKGGMSAFWEGNEVLNINILLKKVLYLLITAIINYEESEYPESGCLNERVCTSECSL